MWRCKICGYQSKEGESPLSKITKKREKIYQNGCRGWEIAEEKFPICNKCVGGENERK